MATVADIVRRYGGDYLQKFGKAIPAEHRRVLAEHALDLWISIYGAEAGNLALKLMATGGVYLGGGIAPKVIAKLTGPLFTQAFVSKGRMQPLLESIPVKVITNDKIALFGAARYAVAKGKTQN